MHCPTCNAEIKDHQSKQCPKCNSLLLESSEQKVLTNGPQTDKQDQYTQEDTSESRDPDEFDLFLEDITTEIDRIVASDKQDAPESTGQVPTEDKAPAKAPDKEIEPAGETKQDQETYGIDEPIDDLEPLIQAFDELVEKDSDSNIEAAEKELPPAAEADEVIELMDVIEPVGPPENEPPAVDTDEIIDLFDTVEPVLDPADEFIETIPDFELQSADEIEPVDFQNDELIEEITEQDFVSAHAPGLQALDDGEVIEEITEQDFVYIEPPAAAVVKEAGVELPVKPKGFPKTIFAAAGVAVLLIAAVLGGKLYFKSKPPSLVKPSKSSAVVVKKKAKKTGIERNLGPAGKSMDKQQVDTAKTKPAVNNTKTAVTRTKVGVDQTPQAKITSTPADEKKVLKGDTSGAAIHPGAPYFTIQVATLKTRSAAESSLVRLRNKGYTAYISEKMTAKGLVRYKLRIGKYKTKAQAKKAAGVYFDTEQKPFIIVQSKEAI